MPKFDQTRHLGKAENNRHFFQIKSIASQTRLIIPDKQTIPKKCHQFVVLCLYSKYRHKQTKIGQRHSTWKQKNSTLFLFRQMWPDLLSISNSFDFRPPASVVYLFNFQQTIYLALLHISLKKQEETPHRQHPCFESNPDLPYHCLTS